MTKETLEQEKLIDAKIKFRYNYTSFVSVSIVITDDLGENFIINIVPPPEVRWFVERSVRIHGSFKTKVVEEFDEHNSLVEAYTFNGFQAIPLETTRLNGGYTHFSSNKHSLSNHTLAKKDNSSDSGYDPFN